jgi:anaerobic selenocysteine-containing dehydrogenase
MDVNRRNYLKGLASIGAGLALTSIITSQSPLRIKNSFKTEAVSNSVLYGGSTIRRSVCLMCHGGCGIEGYVYEGNLIQIRGNPYHPNSAIPNIDYSTDPTTATGFARVCAKGRSGTQHLYDPNRIKHPLKRVGKRGEGQWKVITWDQALDEIVNGDQLLGTDGNNYSFTGLKDLYDHDNDVDPTDSSLGKVANQVIYTIGRSEHGRKEITQRLWRDGFGTWNYQNDHTSICELSHHVAYKEVSGKTHLKPDIENVEYIIWFGTRPLAANFPFSPLANKLTSSLVDRDPPLKMAVVDPTLSKAADKAYRWVPIKPGTDGALALAMIRIMIENDWYNQNYLRNANAAAAIADSYASHTNASYLIDTSTGSLLKDGSDNFLVSISNAQTPVETSALKGDLEPNLGGNIKTGFELLKEEALARSVERNYGIMHLKQWQIFIGALFNQLTAIIMVLLSLH